MRRTVWAAVILFFVLFSLTPAFYELGKQHTLRPERYFELVHNFYTDYNFYLSRIRQGREGAWLVKEKYTSEPHQGSLMQIMYLFMGKVSSWVGVPWPRSGDTYHMARIVLAVTLLGLISYSAKEVFRKPLWQLLAFLLAVTAASWPKLVTLPTGGLRFGAYMPWWSLMDSLQRITFIPHELAGLSLMLFLIMALTNKETMNRYGNWLFLGFLALVLGIIFPPALMFVAVTLGVFLVLDVLVSWPFTNKRKLGEWIIPRIMGPTIVGIISAPSMVYLWLTLRIYPWKRILDFSILHRQPFSFSEYLLAVGPVLGIGLVGVLVALVRRESRVMAFVAWVVAWSILLVVFQFVPGESPLRITQMLPHVPLAFLGVYLFQVIAGKNSLRRYAVLSITAVLIVLGLAQMYSYWLWAKDFLDQKIIATYPAVPTGSTVMYPLKDFVGAIIWLQDNTARDNVILSDMTAGNYIPVYSGNTVYVGHAGTVFTEQKEILVKEFFSGRMGQTRAREFLTANNIHFIFFGPQEKENGQVEDLATIYPFLHERYANTLFRIYEFR